uniref:Methyltransferase, FkbM family n=2 Tax=uncultured Chloroflexota bacterium TaxID=166587 RepID=H5SBC9_9CHLR|nr:methyltransferase, FkbM family [uncultured Chloroflexota bacterium]
MLMALFPPSHFRSIGPCEMVVSYDRDMKFRCDLGSFIEWNIFFKGYYSPDLSLCIKRLVKPGMQVIDVGANAGAYSLLMAKHVGKDGKVVSFEPNPEVFQRLKGNVSLNHFEERIVVKQVALSDRNGEAILWVPQTQHPHRGISSLERYAEILTDQIPVKVERLDNIFAELDLDRLDFIKVDTEGSDARVIEGGMKVIQNFHPIVIFEANYLAHSEADTVLEKIRSELHSLGYQFFTVGYFGRLKRCSDRLPLPDSDIVCIPGELTK